MHTDWDARAGFSNSHESVRARTVEDSTALALLDAIPIRLPFRDGQYLDSPSVRRLAAALEESIYECTAHTLVMPLGLFHADHALVFEACCEVLPRLSHLACFAYEEAIYRRMPGLVQQRLGDLARRGIVATPALPACGYTIDEARRAHLKREAVQAYASQLRAFGPHGCDDVLAPERYWQLSVTRASARRASKRTA
jgi:LmbE family N-acetylglucosaminyl deacetylase